MKPSRLLPPLFALLKFVSGYVLASRAYELHRDEYLYLDYGQQLAWGYLELPPLTALQSWLTLALGGSWFWVKFWPGLWGSLTVLLLGRLVLKLGGKGWAVALASIGYMVAAYARLNFLFQPNSFEVLAFTAGSYALVRHFQTGRPRYLYALGVVLGLSLLNKYTTFFYGAAVLAGLLLTPQRRLLASRHLWGAAGLVLLLWLPNLLWQVAHGVPFRHHMALLHDTQLVHVSVADFWQDQLLMCLPVVWVWVPGLLALLFYGPFRPYRAVGWLYVAGLLLLTVLHGKSYYSLGYYPVLLSFGALWLEQWLEKRRRRNVLRPALLALPVLIMLPLLPFLFTLYPPAAMRMLGPQYRGLGVLRWEDGVDHVLPQDFADMLGWQELADKVWQAYQALPAATRAHTLIKCDNYGQAGAINYYNRHRRMPRAHSFNGSYLFWFPVRPVQPFHYLLLVEDDQPSGVAAHSRSLRQVGEVLNPFARERGTAIFVVAAPDSVLMSRIYREHRVALSRWEGAAP
ncbi:glycosyltransferase family 39 protein [Hymenobacter psychrotolerans]|uniref:Dolichyl-phosphate-mannose-protein mannosyltransferase n=1 Tax=Hymenobacter psychrotolerans DSM 18569 TaxID=1121959 RepID=A0A1M6XXX0_9BACT|nr:glycosyltransferase family 39 protein [Hymenobacter psychrotolerans]SHL10693.1 Dolichyl-phosphate-mannose-protein mannosyltransferase [Hymenobacter psychrotolerans DSM 18569]